MYCHNCEVEGPKCGDDTQEAVELWNHRASTAPEQSDWERARKFGENDLVSPLLESEIDNIAALIAEVRAEERERCIREIERRRIPNTEGCEDHTKDAMGRAMHAWASQELALLRDAIRGSK